MYYFHSFQIFRSISILMEICNLIVIPIQCRPIGELSGTLGRLLLRSWTLPGDQFLHQLMRLEQLLLHQRIFRALISLIHVDVWPFDQLPARQHFLFLIHCFDCPAYSSPWMIWLTKKTKTSARRLQETNLKLQLSWVHRPEVQNRLSPPKQLGSWTSLPLAHLCFRRNRLKWALWNQTKIMYEILTNWKSCKVNNRACRLF